MKKSKKKTALITGITGFAGSHLAELLLTEGVNVCGIQRWRSKTDNIENIQDKIIIQEADLLDAHSLYKVVDEIRPDYIFHLAAQSYVQTSWSSPTNTLEINIIGTANLFEAVKKSGLNIAIQIACSSEEYGKVLSQELPIKETNPLRPLSPYSVSKAAMDYMGYQYFKSYGLKIVRTRGFNHEGPRRGEVFVASNFAKQIALIEKKLQPRTILVGNLDSVRDFTDVRDMVRGYYLAAAKCDPGEVYNISSDSGWVIKDMLKQLLSYSKVKKISVKIDPSRKRPSDVPLLIGDSSKFRSITGWKPRIKFEQTLLDSLNYWRERV